MVHHRHLKFVFKIRNRPQTADDDFGTLALGVIHQQTLKKIRLDSSFCSLEDFADHLEPLVQGKQGAVFLGIDGDGDDDPIEYTQGSFDQVHMPIGHGVEGAGINRDVITCH